MNAGSDKAEVERQTQKQKLCEDPLQGQKFVLDQQAEVRSERVAAVAAGLVAEKLEQAG